MRATSRQQGIARALSLGALSVLIFACSGNGAKNDMEPGVGVGDDGKTPGGGMEGSSTGGQPQVDGVDCAAVVRPPTPLRRLTRFEYDNTVGDLFGTDLTPADTFPPDEVADGFSNNALVLTISSLHAEKYTLASEAVAADAVSRLETLLPCTAESMGAEACAELFAREMGRRVYRRPLEQVDVDVLLEAYAVGDSFEKGIEIMIRAMLQSPHFLFRVESTGAKTAGNQMLRLNDFETATRLSYLLWSSAPDDELLDAAEAGALSSPEQVEAQARRMLADPKARRAVTEFFRQWMETNRLQIISKDENAFPLFGEAMRDALIAEGDAVIEEIVFGDTPTLERLLTAPLGLPTGPLAELYGVAEQNTVTELASDERSGILTLPGFLSVQAHPDQTSPVLRGKFVREKLLCYHVDPPPDNVDISVPNPVEGGTARERFSAHASGGCANCHKLMDPLGYAFESYDALGAYRTTDQGRALDLSGEFVATQAMDAPFDGVHQMSQMLAAGDEVSDCVASQWFKFAAGRGIEDGDICSLNPLQNQFAQSGSNLAELLVATTQTEAFLYRRATSEVSP